ncbi:MAG: phosphate ABC transporter permease PstA [Deltaproteobacteria bacterium]|nr:phosphate ABC transporter permease PstA [Deltaproteobacteria bacterium]
MAASEKSAIECVRATLARRNRAERRFKNFGRAAVLLGLVFLVLMFVNIIATGYSAFWQTFVKLPVHFDAQVIDPRGSGEPETLGAADYGLLAKASLRSLFPEVKGRRHRRDLSKLVSRGTVFQLRRMVLEEPSLVGSTVEMWVPADDDYDMLYKGNVDRTLPEADRRLSDRQIAWFDRLMDDGRVESRFNVTFFTAGDSREPELAGIRGAAIGSFFMLAVTLLLSFPLGVATAVYLEEFAPRNRVTGLIEVNINNLAAVPSIVFGLLGLAVFINLFGLPRSAPLIGGLVLTLMTLPTIIIAGRAALKSVPPSIREAALGVGASKLQMIVHHVLPLAMPGMLTGAIIGMARALGETAPLLMIGMVAFVVDVPQGVTDAATALPVQIFLWLDSPERAFVERASAAIMVLLAFLVAMNALAIMLRRRFERRW